MNLRLIILIAVSMALCGCSQTISFTALSKKIDRDAAPSVTYKGTDDSYHHFRYVAYAGPHFLPQPIRTRQQQIRVPRTSAYIQAEFPLTDDESKWTGWHIGVHGREEFDRDVSELAKSGHNTAAQATASPSPGL